MKKELQEKEDSVKAEVQGGDTCGGKDRPENPLGEIGVWDCVGTEWVWNPAV